MPTKDWRAPSRDRERAAEARRAQAHKASCEGSRCSARSAKNRRSEEEKEDVAAGGEAPPDPWDSEMEEVLADSPAGVRCTSSVAATPGHDGRKK